MENIIKLKKLPHALHLPLPQYATKGSAGMDLLAAINEPVILKSKEIRIIPTGIAIALPPGVEAQIRSRSGLAADHGITVLNSPGTIDADYRGEIKVILINHSAKDFTIMPENRIAQMVIAPYITAEWETVAVLADTTRNSSGFGSTGI